MKESKRGREAEWKRRQNESDNHYRAAVEGRPSILRQWLSTSQEISLAQHHKKKKKTLHEVKNKKKGKRDHTKENPLSLSRHVLVSTVAYHYINAFKQSTKITAKVVHFVQWDTISSKVRTWTLLHRVRNSFVGGNSAKSSVYYRFAFLTPVYLIY